MTRARDLSNRASDFVSFKDFGAVGDNSHDDSTAIQNCITAVGTTGGGIIDGGGLTYLLNTSGAIVEYDNVFIQNAHFKRTSTTTGYLLRFASTTNTNGGGIRNIKFTGNATIGATAGVSFGTSGGNKANNFIAEEIECNTFGQYGFAVEAGDYWQINNVKVLSHGLTTGTISSCIGFYVYPKVASTGGQLNNIYSEISTAAMANAGTNCAAIKLQTHQNLVASNITAIYGSELAMAIDSVKGLIQNVYVKQNGTNAGLVIGNYNTAHLFSGQQFTLDGFTVENGGSTNNNEFLIGGGDNNTYKLTGCSIRNGTGGGAGYLNYSNCKDCTFENLSFEDIRFSASYRGYLVNSYASTGNTFKNISVRGGGMSGVLAIETSNSTLVSCGGNAVDGDTVATFELDGSNNILLSPFVRNCSSNAIKIVGSSNELFNVSLKDITGRSIWFPAGSDTNRVNSGDMYAGTGVLNSGTDNYINGYKKIQYGSAAPATGTWAVGDIVYNLTPVSAGYIGWVCTTAGAPGTWKTFGLIS